MPNGGPDNCSNCLHNRALREAESLGISGPVSFIEHSHCSLRGVDLTRPFWTYCANINAHQHPSDECPRGPIFASGLYEGYVRIPWHGDAEPQIEVPATCAICGREVDSGITIEHEDAVHGFCTNRHYVEWWKRHHADDRIDPEVFQSPEERFDSNG